MPVRKYAQVLLHVLQLPCFCSRRTEQASPVHPQARHRASTSRSRRSSAFTRKARAGQPPSIMMEARNNWAPPAQRRRPRCCATRWCWRATAGAATCFPAACAMLGCQSNRRIRLGRCAGPSRSSTMTGSATGHGLRQRGRRMRRCMGYACAMPAAGRRVRKPAPSRAVVVFVGTSGHTAGTAVFCLPSKSVKSIFSRREQTL